MAGLVGPASALADCVGCRVPFRPGGCYWSDRFATDFVEKYVVKRYVSVAVKVTILTRLFEMSSVLLVVIILVGGKFAVHCGLYSLEGFFFVHTIKRHIEGE